MSSHQPPLYLTSSYYLMLLMLLSIGSATVKESEITLKGCSLLWDQFLHLLLSKSCSFRLLELLHVFPSYIQGLWSLPFRFLHFTRLFLPTKKMITLEAMGRVFYDGPVNPHSPICRILTLTYLRFQYTVLSVIPVTAAFTIGQNHPPLTMLHSTHHNPHLIYDWTFPSHPELSKGSANWTHREDHTHIT